MTLLTAALHRAFSTPLPTALEPTSALNESRHPDPEPVEGEGPPYSAQQPHSPLRTALLRLPTALTLAFGTAALATLDFFWLGIPDSHTWQLALSLLVAVILAIAFLALYATTIRRIRSTPASTKIWLSLALLAIWLLAVWLLIHLIARLDPGIYERAGYLNSRLSPQLRVTFSYLRLVAWQQDLERILTWVFLPALLLPFVIETVARGISKPALSNAIRVLRRWQHWLAVIIFSSIGLWLTGRLIQWHPAHSITGELLSTTLRLGFVYVLDIAIFLLVLGIDSELLARADARSNIPRDPAP